MFLDAFNEFIQRILPRGILMCLIVMVIISHGTPDYFFYFSMHTIWISCPAFSACYLVYIFIHFIFLFCLFALSHLFELKRLTLARVLIALSYSYSPSNWWSIEPTIWFLHNHSFVFQSLQGTYILRSFWISMLPFRQRTISSDLVLWIQVLQVKLSIGIVFISLLSFYFITSSVS